MTTFKLLPRGAEWNVIREELRCDTSSGECQMMQVTRRSDKKRRTARVEESTVLWATVLHKMKNGQAV